MTPAERDSFALLLAVALVTPLMGALNLSPVLGFLFAGIVLGPSGVGLISDVETTTKLAELGVVFFLFEMGLELELERLKSVGRDAFVLGSAQFGLTTALFAGLAKVVGGASASASVVCGGALALSSSAFVIQLLSEKGELASRFGRASFGILLFQDLAVVPAPGEADQFDAFIVDLEGRPDVGQGESPRPDEAGLRDGLPGHAIRRRVAVLHSPRHREGRIAVGSRPDPHRVVDRAAEPHGDDRFDGFRKDLARPAGDGLRRRPAFQSRGHGGLSREDARTAVVAWFEARGLLEEVRENPHAVGHSDRSHVPIEPYLSDQWYVRVTDDRFAGSALRAMEDGQRQGTAPEGAAVDGDGGLSFHPERYARTFQTWHENIRDWCISRQLWWGHRIPIWSKSTPASELPDEIAAAASPDSMTAVDSGWTERGAAHRVRTMPDGSIEETICVPRPASIGGDEVEAGLRADLESAGFAQDPDVLDTWFSSALWPLSTMGWPDASIHPDAVPEGERLLEAFNPGAVLCTAREIITLWVSRMVMFNRHFLGRLPFRDVFIHAMIQDGHGQKMSKSLGNGVDPRDIIQSHGADAMRFTLAQMATGSQDVRMPVDLVCPHSGDTFTPKFVRGTTGHLVASSVQSSPDGSGREMVTAYGVAVGEVEATDERPLARNTSSRFDVGRNFCNKLWNATRFALGNLESTGTESGDPGLADRWIASRLARTVREVDEALGAYQFNRYADAMYDFVWRDFCDWYLEAIKPTVRDRIDQQRRLHAVLDSILRLLHPICPFVTETLWPHVRSLDGIRTEAAASGVDGLLLPPADRCVVAAWPAPGAEVVDEEAEALFDRARNLVAAIRNLRGERQVSPKRRIVLHAGEAVLDLVGRADGAVETLAGLESVVPDRDAPADAIPLPFEGGQVLLSNLVDAVDRDAERKRLEKTIEGKRKQVAGFKAKLGNKGYVDNAPPHLVEETRRMLESAEADLAAAEQGLAGL